jgi:hypothetical protein
LPAARMGHPPALMNSEWSWRSGIIPRRDGQGRGIPEHERVGHPPNFISTFRQGNDPKGDMSFHAEYLLNITGKQSEVNAFGVQNQLRRSFGEAPLDIGTILSRPPYSTNPTLNQPIIPAVTAPQ